MIIIFRGRFKPATSSFGERQPMSVGLDKANARLVGTCPRTRFREIAGRQIAGRHDRPAAGQHDRGHTVAATEIKDRLAA